MRKILDFLRDESGATAIEYAMIGGIVSVVILLGATTMGTQTNSSFSKLGSAFN